MVLAKANWNGVGPTRRRSATSCANPKCASAYVYGRSVVLGEPSGPGTRRRQVKRDDWKVLHRDRYPAYIAWSHYERSLAQLAQNQSRLKMRRDSQGRGVARRPGALRAMRRPDADLVHRQRHAAGVQLPGRLHRPRRAPLPKLGSASNPWRRQTIFQRLGRLG